MFAMPAVAKDKLAEANAVQPSDKRNMGLAGEGEIREGETPPSLSSLTNF